MWIFRISSSKCRRNFSNVWLDYPDMFESDGVEWKRQVIPIDKISEVAWSTNIKRKEIESLFRDNKKVPLILVEEKEDGSYELHDGQHRFAAYRNIFPEAKYIDAAVFE